MFVAYLGEWLRVLHRGRRGGGDHRGGGGAGAGAELHALAAAAHRARPAEPPIPADRTNATH